MDSHVKIIKPISLLNKNNDILQKEQTIIQFQKIRQNLISINLRIMGIFIVFVEIFLTIIAGVILKDPSLSITLVMMVFVRIVAICVDIRNYQILSIYIFIHHQAISIIFLEIILSSFLSDCSVIQHDEKSQNDNDIQKIDNQKYIMLVGFGYSLYNLTVQFILNDWILRCISICISTEYFIIRTSNFDTFFSLGLHIALISLIVLFRQTEKQQIQHIRETINELNQNGENGWKQIIDLAMIHPSFILSLNNANKKESQEVLEIQFMNQHCRQKLYLQEDPQLLDILTQLQYQGEDENIQAAQQNLNNNILNTQKQSIKNLNQLKMANSIYSDHQFKKSYLFQKSQIVKNKGLVNFLDILLKKCQKFQEVIQQYEEKVQQKNLKKRPSLFNFQDKEKSFNQNYSYYKHYSYYENFIFNVEGQQQSYNILTIECMWNGQPSVFVMLNETVEFKSQKNQLEMQQLMAQVVHDLKNPLSGIISISESVENCKNLNDIHHMVNIIKKNGILMQTMIYDIMDYAQINQKGTIKINPSKFEIKQLVFDVKEIFDCQIVEKNLQLNYEIKIDPLQQEIYTDLIRLKQILFNLLSNAIKYTYQGEITIIVEEDKDDQGFLKFSVKDTGVGVPKKIQNKLFQPFATYDHFQGTNVKGVGLGLSICQKLSKLLGKEEKDFKLVSEEKKGSVFSFFIKRNYNDQNQNKLQEYNIQQTIYDKIENSPNIPGLVNQRIQIQKINMNNINLDTNQYINQKVAEQSTENLKINTFCENELQKDNNNDLESIKNESLCSEIQPKDQMRIVPQFKCESIYNINRLLARKNSNTELSPDNIKIKKASMSIDNLTHSVNKFTNGLILSNDRLNVLQYIQSKLNKKTRILIADDNVFNIMTVKMVFNQFKNIDFEEAYNGQQAVCKLQQYNDIKITTNNTKCIHLALIDLDMPIMNGVEAIKEIKNLIEEQQIIDIPIFSLTAYQTNAEKEAVLQAGADEIIIKPITLKSFAEALRKVEFTY